MGGLSRTVEMPVSGILRQLGFDGKSGLIAPKWTPILRRPNLRMLRDLDRIRCAPWSIFFCRRPIFET